MLIKRLKGSATNSDELSPTVKKRLNRTGGFLASLYRYVFLISMSYVILYPMFYMLSASLKTPGGFLDPSIIWIPRVITLENYAKAIKALYLLGSLYNTLIYEMVSAGIEILSCAFAAYGLARFKFRGKSILMVLLILNIFIPPQMIIIPMMMNFADLDFLGILGLFKQLTGMEFQINTLDTVFPFYLPSLFAVGLKAGIMIFIYIQFFKGLPKELEEAAWIDGAGPFKTYLRIALPSSGVVFLTVSVFSIIWHWNDYYLAVMYTSNKLPVSVRLSNIEDMFNTLKVFTDYEKASLSMAACALFVLPMLIMYMILQKKFIKSIDRVGITG